MSDAAIALGSVAKLETLAGGTVRLKIDLVFVTEAERISALSVFGAENCPVVIARQTAEAAQQSAQEQTAAAVDYGQEAKALRVSGFFRAPDVWAAIGTDAEFRAFIQRLPSAVSGEWSEWMEGTGEGRCVAAHVRRAGEAGTAYKPPYACIPLTDAEHKRQHQHGESSIEPVEWWDKKRMEYVVMWGWKTLKGILGYQHWSEVPPVALREWAEKRDLAQYLPHLYQGD